MERDALVLWQVDERDAAQRVTAATLGNGLLQSQTYDPYTGRLTDSVLKTAAQVRRLQEGYQYDPLGNLKNRTQAWDNANFSESFSYDDLNRVKTSQVLGQSVQSYGYDNAGNLKSKTGVGTYDYGPQGAGVKQPHAVKSIGADSYQYDDNGNRRSGGGGTVTWTSFNMPDVITKGSAQSSTFVYGAEHQRVVQTRKDGSTVIYAGAQEAETVGGGTLVRTYWPLGLGMDIDKPGAATELNWVHKDRLGSAVAITDQSGNLKERLEYDTWGKRRTLEGASTPDTLDGQVDNKGCTGHEMLDLLDLIHMNGRVYDPLAARFLSPDFINDAANGQSYNRYTYVLNNPTNLVDPSGYEECESSSYCSVTRSLSNSANMLGVIAVNAQRAATTGVQKVANQSPRIAKVFGQGFVFRANSGASAISGMQDHSRRSPGDPLQGIVQEFHDYGTNKQGEQVFGTSARRVELPDHASGIVDQMFMLPAIGATLATSGVGAAGYQAYRWYQAKRTPPPIVWPPNRGFAGEPGAASLIPGTRVDRYGAEGGTFVAPVGTPFGARSLPESALNKPFNTYEVLKPIEVQAGPAAPWFGQRGGGMQYELPSSVKDLIGSGHLAPVSR